MKFQVTMSMIIEDESLEKLLESLKEGMPEGVIDLHIEELDEGEGAE